MARRRLVIGVVALGAAALAGTSVVAVARDGGAEREVSAVSFAATSSTASSPAPSAPSASPSGSPTPAARASGAAAAGITASRAEQIALRVRPGTVVETGRGVERGRATFEVVVVDRAGAAYEIYVDAQDGRVLKQQRAERDDDAPSVAVPAGISTERARQIALGVRPGQVLEVSLGSERGRAAWEVDVRTPSSGIWEVTVDARTGAVLSQER